MKTNDKLVNKNFDRRDKKGNKNSNENNSLKQTKLSFFTSKQ